MKKYLAIIMTFIMAFVLVGCKKTPELSFEKTSYEMKINEEVELKPTITNLEGTDLVNYVISDGTIIKVEGNKLTALKEGSATITVTLKDYEKVPAVTLNVTVKKVAVTGVEISGDNQVRRGETVKLTATVNPNDASYKEVTWESSDEKIATVSKDGTVTAVKVGTATIKATADGMTGEFEIEVIKPFVSTVIINGKTSMEQGTEQTLEAKLDPEDALKGVDWASSDEKVLKVYATGRVEAIGVGTAKITATSKDEKHVSSSIEITVTLPEVKEVTVTLEKNELRTNEETKATAKVNPANANQEITWSTSDPTIATIDKDGNIKALKSGEVSIIATSKNNVKGEATLLVSDLDKHVVLVDASYEDGKRFVEDGKEYAVGTNAFRTVTEALKAVDMGGRIIVKAGTYAEDIFITNGVSILGANANVNPNTDTRKAESIFTGKITIDGAKNLVINGIALTGKGQITVTDNEIANIVVSNVNVYDKGEATSKWEEYARDYTQNAAINFMQGGIKSNKLIVKDSKFDVKDYAIKFAKVKNVTVSGCTFTNFERDAIRVEGGFNGGVFNFSNNVFENGQKGYNAIFVHYYGNEGMDDKHELNITHNVFKNVGHTASGLTYSAAISAQGYQEGGASWRVNHNTFEGCPNYLLIRNNAGEVNHAQNPWTFEANFNKFVGVPSGVYFNNRFKSNDDDISTPAKATFDHNIYLADDGKTVVTPAEDKLHYIKENTNAFASLVAYEMYKLGIEDEIHYVVNGNWATTEKGSKVTFAGVDFTLGTNAFATIAEALAVAKENEGIYLYPGTYSEAVNITKNGIKLYGPNAGANPNVTNREAEAIIEGQPIILGANVKDVKIQGIQLNGKTRVDVMAGGVDHLVMKNNLLTTSNGSGAHPVIAGYDEANTAALSKNFEFINNRFESKTNSRIVGFYSLEGLVFDGNFISSPGTEYNDLLKIDRPIGEISVTNNIFNGCGQDGMFIGLKDNNITKLDILNNIFDGCGQLVDYGNNIDIRKSKVENAVYNIQYNTFLNQADNELVINMKQFAAAAKVNINHNKFYGTNAQAILNSDKANITFDLEDNYFEDSKYADKVSGVAITKVCAKDTEVKKYPLAPEINIKDITITSNPGTIFQLEEYKLEFDILPANSTNKKVRFSVSDEDVATVNSNGVVTGINPGYVTIYVTSVADPTIEASIEIEVKAQKRIEATLKGETILSKGETSTIESTIVSGSSDDKITWTTSNDKVLTVDASGVVKAVGKGEATIKGTLNTNEAITIEFTFTVVDDIKQLNDLLQTLVKYHNSTVLYQNLHATGYQFEYEQFTYGSVNLYDFEPLDINKSIQVEVNPDNRPGIKKPSIEFITIHNTDSSAKSATAEAHARYVQNHGGGTSWGYSVGNDGIYYQLPDDEVSYHAGDGSRLFKLEDTGVKVTVPAKEAKIAFDEKGFYTVNGQPTKLRPYVWDKSTGTDSLDNAIYKTEQINQMGICMEEKDGTYWMNKTYANGKDISNYGGNRNSIGMETMVNIESNLELTQHRAAKLASNLCIKYGLSTERIVGHHFFSGKICPQTIMENNLWGRFKNICEAEYDIQKNYKDYEIKFESHNPEYLGDNGMIIKAPAKTMTVSYTITVTKGTESMSITLSSVVPGCLVRPAFDWTDM